ncbi:hypothetical protein [Amycolatopsis speibonae]|uniref:hypothetical protein n=1 Tax=Amycolatopsis speibonae TaxID=1450224 RepID=UPI00366D2A15
MPIMSRDQGNSPDWYLYEQAVARLLAEMDPGARVEHHVRVIGELSGRPREIDIRVIGAVAGCAVVVAAECKHRRAPVGIDIVEAFLPNSVTSELTLAFSYRRPGSPSRPVVV